jgi:hypothetical protein
MDEPLQNVNAQIKTEASQILTGKGLLEILKTFGTPHLSGSYALDLMTWKDLDIYLEADDIDEETFFALGSILCTSFHPVKMSFRNELVAKTEGLPAGLYWGVYLGNERQGDWKIDIWMVSRAECQRMLAYVSEIKNKLTPDAVNKILEIKSKCWQDPLFRRSFSSTDIYSAVLENDVKCYKGFMEFVHKKIFSNKLS